MGSLHVRDYPGRAHLNNMTNLHNENVPVVVVPVSALEALFQAQTRQTEIMMNGLQRMTETLCETALKIQEKEKRAREARLNAAR